MSDASVGKGWNRIKALLSGGMREPTTLNGQHRLCARVQFGIFYPTHSHPLLQDGSAGYWTGLKELAGKRTRSQRRAGQYKPVYRLIRKVKEVGRTLKVPGQRRRAAWQKLFSTDVRLGKDPLRSTSSSPCQGKPIPFSTSFCPLNASWLGLLCSSIQITVQVLFAQHEPKFSFYFRLFLQLPSPTINNSTSSFTASWRVLVLCPLCYYTSSLSSSVSP